MINKNNLKKYLIEKNVVNNNEQCEIKELSGGIINAVFRIEIERKNYIIKQFLDEAKIDKKIKLNPKRFSYEKFAITYLDNILGEKVTPPVVFFDEENKIICMEDLGQNNRLDHLIFSEGLDINIFSRIGKIISEIHNKSFFNKALPLLFDNEDFHELKIVFRYYKKIKEPSLIKIRDELIQNCRKNRITLIHNDLKMTNIFVLDNYKICLIDYEGAYYGDPAFEVGYFLGHLFLYYFNQPTKRNKQIILNFWNDYMGSLNFKNKQRLERNITKHIGFIMIYKLIGLANEDFNFIKGKNKERLINISKKIILDDRIEKVYYLFKMA